MALDAVAAILRTIGEFALDHPQLTPAAFLRQCEQWAQHVLLAKPGPGHVDSAPDPRAPMDDARRDWAGVRGFVREYCQHATGHTRTVMTDLRQVVWVFIQSLSQSITTEQQSDARIAAQLHRLEGLALSAPSGELKREVLSTVVEISRVFDERRRVQKLRMDELGAQVRTLGAELDVAKRESETDPVTALFNRRAFDDYLARSVELARAFGQDSCLLLIDVDRFKSINDTFGHAVGDDVLRRVADAITRVFLRKNDFVARFGGDEMAVILRETSLKEGAALGERLLKALRATSIQREGVSVNVTVSVGLAAVDATVSPERWMEAADRALYRAKQEGRDRLEVELPPSLD